MRISDWSSDLCSSDLQPLRDALDDRGLLDRLLQILARFDDARRRGRDAGDHAALQHQLHRVCDRPLLIVVEFLRALLDLERRPRGDAPVAMTLADRDAAATAEGGAERLHEDRKSTRLNSSH